MENKNQLIQYQLINPSDPYTFLTPDLETAALTVFCLGTMYGAEPQGKGENVPVFLFGGAEEWYEEKFGRRPEEGIKEISEVSQMIHGVTGKKWQTLFCPLCLVDLKTDAGMKQHWKQSLMKRKKKNSLMNGRTVMEV